MRPRARAKLVLIDAPAGYGKTTLVAQWRGSAIEDRPFAWVSLDPDDNDPVSLWSHVVHALHRARPEDALDLHQGPGLRQVDHGGGARPVDLAEHLAMDGYPRTQTAVLAGRIRQAHRALWSRRDGALKRS